MGCARVAFADTLSAGLCVFVESESVRIIMNALPDELISVYQIHGLAPTKISQNNFLVSFCFSSQNSMLDIIFLNLSRIPCAQRSSNARIAVVVILMAVVMVVVLAEAVVVAFAAAPVIVVLLEGQTEIVPSPLVYKPNQICVSLYVVTVSYCRTDL